MSKEKGEDKVACDKCIGEGYSYNGEQDDYELCDICKGYCKVTYKQNKAYLSATLVNINAVKK